APSQRAGTAAGTNRKGASQVSTSPASTAAAHAIGGRIMTFAVSVVSAMAGPSFVDGCSAFPSVFGPPSMRVLSANLARGRDCATLSRSKTPAVEPGGLPHDGRFLEILGLVFHYLI